MKMTREQVADLLLRMNDDCSNVVLVSDICEYKGGSLENMLKDIANGWVFEIKDNAVKEVTPAL